MKSLVFMSVAVWAGELLAAATCVSPDGRSEIRLWTDPLAYEVRRDGRTVAAKSAIALTVDGVRLAGGEPQEVTRSARSGTVDTPVYKKRAVDLAGNETWVGFGDWGVRLAARNDGVAYRFETRRSGSVRIGGETAAVGVPDAGATCWLNYGRDPGCEEAVPVTRTAADIRTDGGDRRFVYLPFAYRTAGTTVAVTESDVRDYPIWNLVRAAADGVRLDGVFSPWPKGTYHALEDKSWFERARLPRGGRWIMVDGTEDYLVETDGERTFPWRVFVLADEPAKLCEADIVYALAAPRTPHDFSWVRPGKVAWEWWNCWDNLGPKKGCTTDGYRRFIDFASTNGVEYVILDEGWCVKLDIDTRNPAVDLPELIRYGRERNVGLILWAAWAQVSGREDEIAATFAKLGAKGFKIDFMDRGDAEAERFLWRFAEACAKNRMLIDYHGAHRPTGMSRAYPNVLNYEGVHGLECMKFYGGEDMMDNDVKAFFLRMTAGPLDYTPGAMDNQPVGAYKGDVQRPGSMGTRCRQMAMMVLYEAPLQMLCDGPTQYERNRNCFRFMAKTPVVWRQTVGLGGDPDSFAALARESKDGSWYAAAISNARGRDFVLDTSFLKEGDWQAEIFRDADDADREPTHYVHEPSRKVVAGERLPLRLAAGGGFVIRFVKQ